MTIVSISINDKLLQEIDSLQNDLGYSGRSEIVRDALRMLIANQKDKQKLKGLIDGVLLVIHEEDAVSHIQHEFSGLIKTQVHNHLDNEKCLEIFVVRGDAKEVVKLTDAFQTSKKVDFAKLFIP